MSIGVRFTVSIGLFAILAAVMDACMDAPTLPCGDGYCPPGYTCDQYAGKNRCLSPGDWCGNGIIDKGEMCDDENNVSEDGCSADCASDERCGNGFIDEARGEICDDGNNRGRDGCPSGCRYDCENHEGLYWVCYDKLSWQEARYACQLYGSDLVIINDSSENLRVKRLSGEQFWVGLSDKAEEGTFRWVNGSALSYQDWEQGEPNSAGDEDCVEVGHGIDRQWNDLSCNGLRAFICETPGDIYGSCGNGQIEPGEECDDGNELPNDGCNAACWLEPIPENEPNEDGTPDIGGNDFSTMNAGGPYETDTFIAAMLEPAGDEDVFAVRNRGADAVRVRFETHDMAVGQEVPCHGIDTVLIIRDNQGNDLVHNDDRALGEDLCSTVERDLAPGETVYAHVLGYLDDSPIPAPGYALAIDFQ